MHRISEKSSQLTGNEPGIQRTGSIVPSNISPAPSEFKLSKLEKIEVK